MSQPPSRRSPALGEKFEALRQSYHRSLPGRLEELAAALESARTAPSRMTLEHAFHVAHRLKGTSGSYGLVAVAAELEAIEEILDRARRAGAPLTEGEQEAVSAALARARTLPL